MAGTDSRDRLEMALLRSGPLGEYKHERRFGTTSTGQSYVITISKAAILGWYKVSLYLDEDFLTSTYWTCLPAYVDIVWGLPSVVDHRLNPYHTERCLTWAAVEQAIERLELRLQRRRLLTYRHLGPLQGPPADYYFKVVTVPDGCKSEPHHYILPGDHVRVSRRTTLHLYTHDAIYVGQNKVIHVFGDDKQGSMVREDDWSTFINASEEPPWNHVVPEVNVSVLMYRLRSKSRDDIVATARNHVGICHLLGRYNFFLQNCQHFASYCATGAEISYGVSASMELVKNTLYVLTPARPVVAGSNLGVWSSCKPTHMYSPLDWEP